MPAPPPVLARHVEAALAAVSVSDRGVDGPTMTSCVAAAERLLRRLLSDGRGARDTAIDLLTADALITYAFEMAADTPDLIAARAEDAMLRLAELANAPRPADDQ